MPSSEKQAVGYNQRGLRHCEEARRELSLRQRYVDVRVCVLCSLDDFITKLGRLSTSNQKGIGGATSEAYTCASLGISHTHHIIDLALRAYVMEFHHASLTAPTGYLFYHVVL